MPGRVSDLPGLVEGGGGEFGGNVVGQSGALDESGVVAGEGGDDVPLAGRCPPAAVEPPPPLQVGPPGLQHGPGRDPGVSGAGQDEALYGPPARPAHPALQVVQGRTGDRASLTDRGGRQLVQGRRPHGLVQRGHFLVQPGHFLLQHPSLPPAGRPFSSAAGVRTEPDGRGPTVELRYPRAAGVMPGEVPDVHDPRTGAAGLGRTARPHHRPPLRHGGAGLRRLGVGGRETAPPSAADAALAEFAAAAGAVVVERERAVVGETRGPAGRVVREAARIHEGARPVSGSSSGSTTKPPAAGGFVVLPALGGVVAG